MLTIPEILTELDRLTTEQGELIFQNDFTALEENIEKKNALITALKAVPQPVLDEESRTLLDNISAAGQRNIQMTKGEMGRLRGLMKKTQEGMTTERGYDAFSFSVGATYIDAKK